MKVRSIKTLVLTEEEVIEAAILWLQLKGTSTCQRIAAHMKDNAVSVDATSEGFAFDMDGMWEEEG